MNRMLELLAITDQFVQALPKGVEIVSLKSDGADFYLRLECTGTDERSPIQVFDTIVLRSTVENGRWRDSFITGAKPPSTTARTKPRSLSAHTNPTKLSYSKGHGRNSPSHRR